MRKMAMMKKLIHRFLGTLHISIHLVTLIRRIRNFAVKSNGVSVSRERFNSLLLYRSESLEDSETKRGKMSRISVFFSNTLWYKEESISGKKRRSKRKRFPSIAIGDFSVLLLPIFSGSFSVSSFQKSSAQRTSLVSAFCQRSFGFPSKAKGFVAGIEVCRKDSFFLGQNQFDHQSRMSAHNVYSESGRFKKSSSVPISLPPWLEVIEEESMSLSSEAEVSKRIHREIAGLETSLLSYRGGKLFSEVDVGDIVRAICCCANNSNGFRNTLKLSIVIGSVAFCRLLLKLEDCSFDDTESTYANEWNTKNRRPLITKDFLIASILHYSECVSARYDGVYEEVQQAIWGFENFGMYSLHEHVAAPPLLSGKIEFERGNSTKNLENTAKHCSVISSEDNVAVVLRKEGGSNPTHKCGIETADTFKDEFSDDVRRLAEAALRLKRVEILVSSICYQGKKQRNRRPLTKKEYGVARNLMVSLSEDWRALAIRCAASLFRMEGILQQSKIHAGSGQFSTRSVESILAAKDSLHMYANLSQQLGLQQLQKLLEESGFRILYRRQYSAASALFQHHRSSMNTISNLLSKQVNKLLCGDASLMQELDSLEIVSRVKEPYSFWRKLLRTRIRPILNGESRGVNAKIGSSSEFQSLTRGGYEQNGPLIQSTNTMSITEVNDAIALRVILKARKRTLDESIEATHARERLLCYYVHHLVRSIWPETDSKRVKDYIRHPKANGYQSLHHTSKVRWNEKDFLFEVQIRSDHMHQKAEFGLASHSTYKLGGSTDNDISAFDLPLPSAEIVRSESRCFSPLTSTQKRQDVIIDSAPLHNSKEDHLEFLGPYISALKRNRNYLMDSQVHVFLAGKCFSTLQTGQLLNLTAGSIILDVLDILRRVSLELVLENDDVSVWRNGQRAELEEIVENGDVILVEPQSASTTENSTSSFVTTHQKIGVSQN